MQNYNSTLILYPQKYSHAISFHTSKSFKHSMWYSFCNMITSDKLSNKILPKHLLNLISCVLQERFFGFLMFYFCWLTLNMKCTLIVAHGN